jgi:hypothetical protein
LEKKKDQKDIQKREKSKGSAYYDDKLSLPIYAVNVFAP